MTNEVKSRSIWSTALVSFFGGPFGGFLWIGSGKWAVTSLVVISAISVVVIYNGFPVLLSADLTTMATLSGIGLGVLWMALVVPFAGRFKPGKWYSHGAAVLVLAFLSSPLAAFVIRSFLIQSFSISSSSMAPTLQSGDYLLASKFAYGYSRYSLPFGLLPVDGRVLGTEPQRGDVVILRPPSDPDVDYVERVVGLPGDTIQMIDGTLQINGVAVKLEDMGTFTSEELTKPVKLQRETLPNGVSHSVLSITDTSVGDNTRLWTVPEGNYFVMGDNRDNSNDSRFRIGFVPYENLVGKAARLYWNSKGVDYSSRQILNGSAAK